MKETTRQWLEFAEKDLKACEKLLDDTFLTNVVAFHSQQVIEKCFKAIIEESNLQLPRIHSLSRLYGLIQNTTSFDIDLLMLQKADTVYSSSRYPIDLGLMPDGNPTLQYAQQLFEFAEYIFINTVQMLEN